MHYGLALKRSVFLTQVDMWEAVHPRNQSTWQIAKPRWTCRIGGFAMTCLLKVPRTMWIQREFALSAKCRGFHLVTSEVLSHLPELASLKIGLMHLFIQHTSASLTLNENADPDVRTDMETYFNSIVPERGLPLTHTIEGPDDMPAHVKSSLLGSSVSMPIRDGRLALGTWQGIYLCEHRNQGGRRKIVATLNGEGA